MGIIGNDFCRAYNSFVQISTILYCLLLEKKFNYTFLRERDSLQQIEIMRYLNRIHLNKNYSFVKKTALSILYYSTSDILANFSQRSNVEPYSNLAVRPFHALLKRHLN
ncbi:hypothetical protein BpHYR1_001616 [Brachionus plicatilis]|uniref:Uncharacterized protein n=1 Tax=Brachionus plicatilis TaxID=10195 RepID=A0A3M7Q9Y6_BRAPC|nr:hypothetical protein BpHYR1_001616 [Brachionus plicatilis]